MANITDARTYLIERTLVREYVVYGAGVVLYGHEEAHTHTHSMQHRPVHETQSS